MLSFQIKIDARGYKTLTTRIRGKALLTIPQLNKGTAFTYRERHDFGLMGKLPSQIETLHEQVQRCYRQVMQYDELVNRNIYLNNILNTNQVLFYRLVKEHLEDLLPMIYTPVVGAAVESYSETFTQPRGLYINYNDKDHLDEIFDNRSNPEIDVIVVSDGEGVLGIGDQGVGAMAIPVAKLAVYTLFGGIDPMRTLPIMLDVGTNNETLLKDPFYLGWRHKRISGADYDQFVHSFVNTVQEKFPNVFLHWEDFGRKNAYRNLSVYRDRLCSFNDDIQGTGIVALAALISAVKKKGERLQDQRILIFGAGSAGMGITYSIYRALQREGLDEKEAAQHFYLVDKSGLLTQASRTYSKAQEPFLHPEDALTGLELKGQTKPDLQTLVAAIKPTVLIGTSAQGGAFNEGVVTTMQQYCEKPVILPLSNPNKKCEAHPHDLLSWTNGQALIATGSPFGLINWQSKKIRISQCNNYLAFPGIGLGILAIKAKRLNNEMLHAASAALSQYSNSHHELLPHIDQAEASSRAIAIAVAKAGVAANLQGISIDRDIESYVDAQRWEPSYLEYHSIA